ncbi:MAG: cysteate synthase [Alkalispirochaeta sp.]
MGEPAQDLTIRPIRDHETDHYQLQCLKSGALLSDTREHGRARFPLAAPNQEGAFLRSVYRHRRLRVGPADDGLFRFDRWLPIQLRLPGSGAPITYRSTALAAELGLHNLYVTFSGWWPERGARIPTGTFKEHEAYAVYGRMGTAAYQETLVVASAGNTARAFLRVASENNLPLVVVVPEAHIPDLWTVGPRGPSTVVVAAGDGSDYSDAIHLAQLLCSQPGFLAEGGAKNVARRDGMGTTYLSAAYAMGRTPDHYVQAVGSGTGAIAAWEANMRLLRDGTFGTTLSQLHLAQNAPFQVLVDSWHARSRQLLLPDVSESRWQVAAITAKVLANRNPPWAPVGGLFDALQATRGQMYAIPNEEAASAGALFTRLEGIDPSPAAAVACGALVRAVQSGNVHPTDHISLNITGGGFARARAELDTPPLNADIIAGGDLFDAEAIATEVRRIQTIRRKHLPV